LERLFPTFHDIESLQSATGRPALGTIAMAVTDVQQRHRRAQGLGVAAAGVGLFVVQAGWVAWLAIRTTI
jgi:hypothetical protein